MSFEPFEFGQGDELTRGQWMALAHMALGKAQRIEANHYGVSNRDDEGDGVDTEEWANNLRQIADTILGFFQPGDGKL